MHIVETTAIGIAAMRSNKMRSLLTMLGIIIGITAVLAMITIGDGAKEIVRQDVQKLRGSFLTYLTSTFKACLTIFQQVCQFLTKIQNSSFFSILHPFGEKIVSLYYKDTDYQMHSVP